MYVCVFMCVCVRKRSWGMPGMSIVQFGKEWWGADYCVSWFLAPQTSVLPRSPGTPRYKNLNNGMCVCVCVHFAHQSVCGQIPNNHMNVCVCVCVWSNRHPSDSLKQASTNKKNKKKTKNKTKRASQHVHREDPERWRMNSSRKR